MFWSGVWGVLILLSLAGWGGWICRLTKHAQAGCGLRGALGLAAMVAIGGILNLTHLISRASVVSLILFGLVLFLFTQPFRMPSRNLGWATALLLCAATDLLVLRYAGSLRGSTDCWEGTFQCGDDLRAYLVFPNRMLQTGALGEDPFSFRRLKSSLGGQSFLLVLLRSALPENSLNQMENGIGAAVAAGVLFEIAATPAAGAVAVLLFLVLPSPIVNTTSAYTSLALFLALYVVLSRHSPRRDVPAGLLAAAICALKSTNIPAAVLLLLFFFGVEMFRRKVSWREPLWTGGLTLAFLLPWMVDMYRTMGTLLYPILGKGYATWAAVDFAEPYGKLPLVEWLRFSPRATMLPPVLFVLAGIYARHTEGRTASRALTAAALAGTVITVAALGGYYPYRFVFPFLGAAILVTFLLLLPALSEANVTRKITIGATLLAGVYLVAGRPAALAALRQTYAKAVHGLRVQPDHPRDYGTMEERVPDGAALLARLERPYLLDFHRHRIFAIDWPGALGYPPGMPLESGEKLASYLTDHAIRYVAYDYATQANVPESWVHFTEPGNLAFNRVAFTHVFQFNACLRELGATRRRIFDDRKTFVVDLRERN